ncbi:hypothetical protein BKA62DRAFT_756534 [Auriculariales sp. MPI-PUGE-AT-0066]|nr:hypothetical protein BKA62DRAFT_756534 [Auriculariales sp. MPI-PUGE-AT-0066]
MGFASAYDTSRLKRAVEVAWNEALSSVDAESCYPDSQYTVQSIREAILSVVYATIVDLSLELNNARSAVRTLPSELLTIAFSNLPILDLVSASSVCKDWRALLATTPTIWSTFTYGPAKLAATDRSVITSPRAMEDLLRLSLQTPLQVEVRVEEPGPWNEVFKLLRRNMRRMVGLQLSIYSTECTDNDVAELFALISTPAPKLETFLIADIRDVLSKTVPNPGCLALFDNIAPLLHDVVLRMNLAHLIDSSGLILSHVTNALYNQVGLLSPKLLAKVTNLAPNTLDLTICFQSWDATDEATHPEVIPLPSELKTLTVFANGSLALCVPFFASLRWRDLSCVEVYRKSDDDDAFEQVFNLLCDRNTNMEPCVPSKPFIIRTAAIDWYMTLDPEDIERGPIIHMFDAEQNMHVLVPFHHGNHPVLEVDHERIILEYRQPLVPELFVHLTRMYLSELVFNPEILQHAVPPLPSLTHLVVWMMPAQYHKDDIAISSFIQAAMASSEELASFRALICPALRELTIAASTSDWTPDIVPRLSPEMINAFVRAHLRFQTSSLELLSLTGGELVFTAVAAFDVMVSLAHTIICDTRFMAWAANHRPENQAGLKFT